MRQLNFSEANMVSGGNGPFLAMAARYFNDVAGIEAGVALALTLVPGAQPVAVVVAGASALDWAIGSGLDVAAGAQP